MRDKQANAGNKRKTGKVGKENHQNVASFSQRKDARRGDDVAFRGRGAIFKHIPGVIIKHSTYESILTARDRDIILRPKKPRVISKHM